MENPNNERYVFQELINKNKAQAEQYKRKYGQNWAVQFAKAHGLNIK